MTGDLVLDCVFITIKEKWIIYSETDVRKYYKFKFYMFCFKIRATLFINK